MLLAFCLVASALPIIPYGMVFYIVSIIFGFITTIIYAKRINKQSFLVYLFICFISSTFALMFDYRIFVFSIILLSITPIIDSIRLFEFRKKYITFCLHIFPILSLVCLYCYFVGINYMSLVDGNVDWDFSAIFSHSMWLGAANGISNVVLLWNIYAKKRFKVVYFVWLLSSLFLSVVSGSRSALAASLLAMLFLVYLNISDIKSLIRVIVIIAIVALSSASFYISYATRMISKIEYQQESGRTSRDGLFRVRFIEIQESPIIGVGFAVSRNRNTLVKQLGRTESGSGWLSIICQTGLLGFFVILYILRKAYLYNKNRVRHDNFLMLITSVFAFLCLHSFFEGYILTSGYYLCILFWGILGIMLVYPQYVKSIN